MGVVTRNEGKRHSQDSQRSSVSTTKKATGADAMPSQPKAPVRAVASAWQRPLQPQLQLQQQQQQSKQQEQPKQQVPRQQLPKQQQQQQQPKQQQQSKQPKQQPSPPQQQQQQQTKSMEQEDDLLTPPGLDAYLPASASKAARPEDLPSNAGVAPAAAEEPECPAGCRPPPGLEGVDLRWVESTVCHVIINGLPKKLLNHTMTEVVIEQAGFEDTVTAFTVQRRSEWGREVVLGFSCRKAAQACLAHFEGCQWGAQGVTCRLHALEVEETAEVVERDEKEDVAEAQVQAELLMRQSLMGFLPPQPPAWVAMETRPTWELVLEALQPQSLPRSRCHTFSADAPAFVPNADAPAFPIKALSKDAEGQRKISDVSTDVGESELSDDMEALEYPSEGRTPVVLV